ncbi:MAG: ABC transporter substrate-binding protein, partial [Casimicrobiaceae bacterium]
QTSIAAFRKGLADMGFVEGRTVTIEYRPGDGRTEQMPELAADLVRRRVAVIMAATPAAALAAKRATQTIPVVFTSGADPLKIGLVSSFNKPGGNVTGFHIQYGELTGKRLSLLQEMVPRATRIAVLVNPANPSDAEQVVRNAIAAGRELGLDIKVFHASGSAEIDAAFAAIVGWRAGAVFIGNEPVFANQRAQIAALAEHHALAASGFSNGIRAGELMNYGPDSLDSYRQAGVYVGRILKGEGRRPAGGAAEQIHINREPPYGEGARPHDSAVGATARG